VRPAVLVTHSDRWVADRIGRWRPPPWVEVWMVVCTRLGDGWAWMAVMASPGGRGPSARILAQTLVAITVVNVVQVTLKRAFRRARPLPSRRGRIGAPDRFSFPSGHTMNAFAVAVLVSLDVPAAAPWALAAAASVGASRVVLQMHYVSDVVAGAVLGALLAAGVVSTFGR
jgi:undecaprenyl-diphosphatase